jgi:hypothetical protein
MDGHTDQAQAEAKVGEGMTGGCQWGPYQCPNQAVAVARWTDDAATIKRVCAGCAETAMRLAIAYPKLVQLASVSFAGGFVFRRVDDRTAGRLRLDLRKALDSMGQQNYGSARDLVRNAIALLERTPEL